MNTRIPLFNCHALAILLYLSLFAQISARYLEVRQIATPTSALSQASANNALCVEPNPTAESLADAALDRGVPFFLNDVLTEDFLPNHGNSMADWFEYVWEQVEPPENPVPPVQCISVGQSCPVFAECGQLMELFWTQNTIINFQIYINIFASAFTGATLNISTLVGGVSDDFPIQVPSVSEAAIFNNFGAALTFLGEGIGLFGGENPGASLAGGLLGMLGGVFSDVGSGLQTSNPTDSNRDLEDRLNHVYSQVSNSSGFFLDAVMKTGDLSAYPSRIYSGSQYNNTLVAFFDNGNFLINSENFTSQNLMPLLSAQLLTTITGTAVVEANYYIMKDAYDVADCPAGPGLTGVVIDNSCFTLEVAGEGANSVSLDEPSSYSNQMEPATVRKLVDFYQVSLSDLYTSSYSCQNASNAYGMTLDFSSLELTDVTAVPPCFYNLPVFQVAPPSAQLAAFGSSPCAAFATNGTATTQIAGLTFLPDNLLPIFTKAFCELSNPDPFGKDVDFNSIDAD